MLLLQCFKLRSNKVKDFMIIRFHRFSFNKFSFYRFKKSTENLVNFNALHVHVLFFELLSNHI